MAVIGPNAAIELLELLVRIQTFPDANLDEKTGYLDKFSWFSQSFQENPDIIRIP
jgi:hypothetical protein